MCYQSGVWISKILVSVSLAVVVCLQSLHGSRDDTEFLKQPEGASVTLNVQGIWGYYVAIAFEVCGFSPGCIPYDIQS